jgi:hypothetical protein
MKNIQRTINLTRFVLTEYVQTWRFVLALLASIAFFYVFLARGSAQADHFFATTGLYTLLLTLALHTWIFGLADRAAGYIPFMHGLKRANYLLGHYFAVQVVVYIHYIILCIAFVLIRHGVSTITPDDWLLGSLPLVLNISLFGAFLTLLSSIVLSNGWRLAILAAIAIAFSGQWVNSKQIQQFTDVANFLEVIRTITSTPLLPGFTGFALSVSRDYSSNSFIIPISQLSLIFGLLAMALYAFNRRELDFKER